MLQRLAVLHEQRNAHLPWGHEIGRDRGGGEGHEIGRDWARSGEIGRDRARVCEVGRRPGAAGRASLGRSMAASSSLMCSGSSASSLKSGGAASAITLSTSPSARPAAMVSGVMRSCVHDARGQARSGEGGARANGVR